MVAKPAVRREAELGSLKHGNSLPKDSSTCPKVRARAFLGSFKHSKSLPKD